MRYRIGYPAHHEHIGHRRWRRTRRRRLSHVLPPSVWLKGRGGVNQFSFFIGGGGVNEGTSEIGTKKSGRSDSFLLPNRRQRSIDRLYWFLESGVPLNFVFLEFFFVYFFFFYFHRLRSQVRVLQRPPRLGTGWRRASYSRDAVSVLRVRRDLQGRRPLVGRTWRTRQPMTAKGLDYLFLGCPVWLGTLLLRGIGLSSNG